MSSGRIGLLTMTLYVNFKQPGNTRTSWCSKMSTMQSNINLDKEIIFSFHKKTVSIELNKMDRISAVSLHREPYKIIYLHHFLRKEKNSKDKITIIIADVEHLLFTRYCFKYLPCFFFPLKTIFLMFIQF